MAEAALFTLASKVLTTIISDSFKMAYEKTRSIKKARKELEELRKTVQTIQSILVDAEKQQQDYTAVKNWINRVRDALYDADDLFDEVIADDLLKQQRGMLKKVWSPFSMLKSNDSIAKKVTNIRKCFDSISKDMVPFNFVKLGNLKPTIDMMRGVETGAFVNPDEVIGRDEDKKIILDYVEDRSSYANRNVSVIAIVGIGGMGKSTLAKLVYNDPKVSSGFRKRWWACINDISDEKEVTGKIFRSITGNSYHELSLNDLQMGIREYISKNGKYLLVLDDLWDENHAAGRELRSLLSSDDAKGSRIIVTTRSSSVARAVDADKTHVLNGLSEDASWKLFKSLAFTGENQNDKNWIELGRKVVKKCANVPLAIKSIASLLYAKATLLEWKSFENEELSNIELSRNPVMSALKLSYLHLSPNLKPCFAYCSLFPKNYKINKDELINLWIAQGYVEPNNEKQTVEEAGHGYFMELVRRFFIEKAREDISGEVWEWKMHDLIHDLTQNVAGEESSILIRGSNKFCKNNRHLSIGCETNSSWNIPPSLLVSSSGIRSFLFVFAGSPSPLVLGHLLTKFKLLRTLSLSCQGIEKVSCSIGELKHLRYLDISGNNFTHLPDSITKLVNLLLIDISQCARLEILPREFRKLVSLRHLYDKDCYGLRYMPCGLEKLTCLQTLPCFKVGKAMGAGNISCRVDALAALKLKGMLDIVFDGDVDDCNGVDCWQLPATISILSLWNCTWMKIPQWWQSADLPSNLVKLYVDSSSTVEHLPPLRHLPCLKHLQLSKLTQLKYIEDDREENKRKADTVSIESLFFPCLEKLVLCEMPLLKAWSRQVKAILAATIKGKTTDGDNHLDMYKIRGYKARSRQEETIAASKKGKATEGGDDLDLLQILPSLPVLSTLHISDCKELKCMPLLPHLHKLQLAGISEVLVLQLLSTSLHPISSRSSSPSPYLETISITRCSLNSILCIGLLTTSQLPRSKSRIFEMFDAVKGDVNWESFPNLRHLTLGVYQKPTRLPDCLQRLQDQGILHIYLERPDGEFFNQTQRPMFSPTVDVCNLILPVKSRSNLILPVKPNLIGLHTRR